MDPGENLAIRMPWCQTWCRMGTSGRFPEWTRRRSPLLAAAVLAVTGGLALAAVALAGGFGGPSHALYGAGTGVGGPVGPVGRVWAAGTTALCTSGHSPVVLTRITPLEVDGQVEVDRFVIRRVEPADEITLSPGAPLDSQPAVGYVIHSPSPCAWPGSARMNEVVVLATRTGPYGGSIRGLRVDYRSGGSSGSYVIPSYFVRLCGPYGACGSP
jgi:hypothetical protein